MKTKTAQSEETFQPEHQRHQQTQLIPTAFYRLKKIIGDPKADPPIPALIPISKSAWYQGIADGIYPAPVKLSERTSAWKTLDIIELIDRLGQGGAQ